MNDKDKILGLFFTDKNNLIYENIKFSENLSEKSKNNLNMLSYKFLGPIFLTAASCNEDNWKIELIESSLSLHQGIILNPDIIQSFFSLNSSIKTDDGITNLFALIGSNYTEDIKYINNILSKYIHPSIIQGKIVNEDLLGSRFHFHKFIKNELIRGLHLIDYCLGNSRKVYWEEQHTYSCVGLIERIISAENKNSNLYTFDKNDLLRKKTLNFIPSYYVMSILPHYYENLIDETLKLFNKTSIYPNIRVINLCNKNKKVVYLEEFIAERNIKKSFGAILVQDNKTSSNSNNISFYRKNLRLIIDGHKELCEMLEKFNPNLKYEKWATQTDDDLNKLRAILDNINN
jgi:hypothetical protein